MAIIRVSGYPGAGKTTFCEQVVRRLGYAQRLTSKLYEDLAKAEGKTKEQFYEECRYKPEIERMVDDEQERIMLTTDNIVVDGRIAPFRKAGFPALNVLLDADPVVRAKRRQKAAIYLAHKTLDEVIKFNAERVATERKHYYDLYGIEDHLDSRHFDVRIDTSWLEPAKVFNEFIVKLPGRWLPLIFNTVTEEEAY